MATPRPTGSQVAMIAGGAAAGAVLAFAIGIGGTIGGAIVGFGAAMGAIPYTRAIQEQKKSGGG